MQRYYKLGCNRVSLKFPNVNEGVLFISLVKQSTLLLLKFEISFTHDWTNKVILLSMIAICKFVCLTGQYDTIMLFKFQLLGECHCWWTSESPRAHVAKFYGRLRLVRSVWRASKFSVFKID